MKLRTKSQVKQDRDTIVAFVTRQPGAYPGRIAQETGINYRIALQDLSFLRDRGLLSHFGCRYYPAGTTADGLLAVFREKFKVPPALAALGKRRVAFPDDWKPDVTGRESRPPSASSLGVDFVKFGA